MCQCVEAKLFFFFLHEAKNRSDARRPSWAQMAYLIVGDDLFSSIGGLSASGALQGKIGRLDEANLATRSQMTTILSFKAMQWHTLGAPPNLDMFVYSSSGMWSGSYSKLDWRDRLFDAVILSFFFFREASSFYRRVSFILSQ